MRLGALAAALAMLLAAGPVARAESQGPGLLSITFDDASMSQHALGLRAAREHGLVGTLFVVTGFADKATRDPDGWYMGWSEIRAFRDAGWEIGSHSHTHPHLSRLDDPRLIAELDTSKATILKRTGIAPVSFAPPFGDFNARTVKRVMERFSHHLLAWGGNRGRNPMQGVDATRIGRLDVSHQDSPARICDTLRAAARDRVWLVLMFHEFVQRKPGKYQYQIDDFRSILACARLLQDEGAIRVVTVAQAMDLLARD